MAAAVTPLAAVLPVGMPLSMELVAVFIKLGPSNAVRSQSQVSLQNLGNHILYKT
jgi:hypothetical protein